MGTVAAVYDRRRSRKFAGTAGGHRPPLQLDSPNYLLDIKWYRGEAKDEDGKADPPEPLVSLC